MLASHTRRTAVTIITAGLLLFTSPLSADLDSAAIGLDDLIARLGPNTPDGTGIIAGHTEAPNGNGNWAPNPGHSQFRGKTFFFAPANPTNFSNHATTVGRHYYGNVISAAPGIDTIYAWEVNFWLNTSLNMNRGNTPPDQIEADILNNSWIGTFGNNSVNNQALRRVDFLTNDQSVMVVAGVNNNTGWSSSNILLSHMFNGVSVGRSDGNHNAGTTFNGIDMPGRMKPEIVAPDNATSWSTGIISGCIALLRETARDAQGTNPNADRPEIIKATLLGGATHRAGWSNFPDETGPTRGVTTTPIDPLFGVDQVNVNTSHLILTAGEQDGTMGTHGPSDYSGFGWDLATVNSNEAVYYRFDIAELADEVIILTTWNRDIPIGFSTFEIPNFELELFAIVNDQRVSLRGADAAAFTSGNIASVSPVDNIEHLVIQGLAAGSYALEVKRTSDGLGAWDVATTWITPENTAATPADLTSVMVVNGTLLGGGLADLLVSDDSYVHTRSGFGPTFIDLHNMEMVIGANTSNASPTTLDISVEQRIDQPAGNGQVKLFNWNTGEFDVVGSFAIGSTDAVHVSAGIDATNYVSGAGDIDVAVKHNVFVPFLAFTFESFVDQVEIVVR